MAILKFLSLISLDNNNNQKNNNSLFRNNNNNYSLLFFKFNQVCSFSPKFNYQTNVSKFDTNVTNLQTHDCNFTNPTLENNDNSHLMNDNDIDVDTTILPVDTNKVRRVYNTNIWTKFRNSNKGKNYVKKKPTVVVYKRFEQEMEKNTVFSSDGFDYVEKDSSFERCNAILKEFERSGDDGCDKALSFFQWMRENGKLEKNGNAFNLILRVYGRKSDWVGAERVVKEMVELGCEVDCRVFNTVLYSICKKGVLDVGVKWFRMMLEYGVRPNVATFGMVMSLYRKGWVVEEAEFTFSCMRDMGIRCESAYSAMITIYTRMRLFEKAEGIIRLLREDEVVLNLENWLVMLNAYCQQGKLNDAEEVFEGMVESGFSPNIVAYNTMITGYGKVAEMGQMEKLLCGLKEVGLEPDETTYRSLIEGWGRAGNYELAKLYYVKLQRKGFKPNSSNLFTLINLQAKHGDEEGVVKTIDDMIMVGCQKPSILSNVLHAYEKANKLNKLPSVLEGSLYGHVLQNQTSCTILVTAYVKNGLIDNATKVLQDKKWEDPVFEDNLYHLLICLCKDMNDLENAVKIFTSMRNSGKPNLNIFCTMIDIYSTMSLFSEAELLYKKLKNSGIKLDMIAFSIITRMYLKSGSLKEACTVLDVMDKEKNIVPDVYLLRDMFRIYQRCGMNDKLADLYYKVVKNAANWDEEMYNCVINCCAFALSVDELSRLFDEMLQRGYAPNTITFNVILNVYGKSRLFEKARRVFWIAKKRGLLDVISYNTLIAAYGKNKYLKNMSAAVRKMQFDGFSVSLEAYNCMLDVYGKEGEMEKFRSVLERMKDSNCASDRYTYNIMINIYGEQGWIEEVAEVLTELKACGIAPDLCSYNTLIKAYGIAGKVEDAVALVKEMRKNGIVPDRLTYSNLITALRKNDMFLEAVKWSLWMKQMGL